MHLIKNIIPEVLILRSKDPEVLRPRLLQAGVASKVLSLPVCPGPPRLLLFGRSVQRVYQLWGLTQFTKEHSTRYQPIICF